MKTSTTLLKHSLGIGATLVCSALLISCAGKSPKPTAELAPEQLPVTTVQVQQPVIEPTNTPDIQAQTASVDKPQDPILLAALDSDNIDMAKPEQRIFQFGFDKAELGKEDKAVIRQHAKYLRDHPNMMVNVIGHTDHHGPKAYNEYLSKKRAEAVSAILLAEGVLESQISIQAMANDEPAENAQHARDNRRVELQFESVNLVSK